MTVRVLSYRGDGSYYLADPGHELDGLRSGPPGRVLRGSIGPSVPGALDELLAEPLRNGRRALDVIVAAPKPISVLLAIESRTVASRVVALHAHAVDAVVSYLCDDAPHPLGRTDDARVVAFTHGVNRLCDPHLHSHVLVGARRCDGVPFNSRAVHRRAAAADALYLAVLRHGLVAATGRVAWLSSTGAVRVEGVDHGLVAAMSAPRTRDGRVERSQGKTHPSSLEVRQRWDEVVDKAVPLWVPEVPRLECDVIDEYRFAAVLGDGLVGAADVLEAWASACTFGDAADRLRAAASSLAPDLGHDGRRPAVGLRAAFGVVSLGPRPTDPAALRRWQYRETLLSKRASGLGKGARRRTPAALLESARLDAEIARPLTRDPGRSGDGLTRR